MEALAVKKNVSSAIEDSASVANIASLFEKIAIEFPHATALLEDNASMSFEELNLAANKVANSIRMICPDVRNKVVALFLPQGKEAVISILAIWKLDAAYLPIPLNQPISRQIYILENSTAIFGIHLNDFDTSSYRGLKLTSFGDLLNKHTIPHFEMEGRESDLAWILYTSGSTGRPKGVLGSHKASLNRIFWMWRDQPIEDDEVLFQNTALTTVDSVWEIWGALCAGKPLRILPEQVTRDARSLVEAIKKYDLQRVCLVPSYLSTILWHFPDLGNMVPKCRLWVVSGESLTNSQVEHFYRCFPNGILMNQYGLTETCADITFFDTRRMVSNEKSGASAVPIGKPIDNVVLRILDNSFNDVAPGEEGELYVGGLCLAHGYQGDEKLTSIRFVNLPSGKNGQSGGRFLRTGDYVRWREPYGLLYCGRIDKQVKIRGYRVEIEEIEETIVRNGNVTRCAVVLRPDKNGNDRLVCFIEPSSTSLMVEEVRQRLISNLPDYMVPSLFRFVKIWPHTASGKIDRDKLPNPYPDSAADSFEIYQPIDDIEERLCVEWNEVTSVPLRSKDDNFFQSGGDSLSAMRLLSKIFSIYGKKIDLGAFIQSPIFSDLVWKIKTESSLDLSKKGSFEGKEHQVLVTQEPFWFWHTSHPMVPIYNFVSIFKIHKSIDAGQIEESLNYIASKHPALRSKFLQTSGGLNVELTEPAKILFEMHEADISSNENIRRFAEQFSQQPLDPSKGELIKGIFVKTSFEKKYLIIVMHHIVCDAASIRILGNEIAEFCKGTVTSTAEKPLLAYQEAAAWLRYASELAPKEPKSTKFIERLKTYPKLVTFPSDNSRQNVQRHLGKLIDFVIDEQLMGDLDKFARAQSVTLFILLAAAFQYLLSLYSGEKRVAIGVPMSLRDHPSTDGVVGPIVNTVVLASDFTNVKTFDDLLSETRNSLSEAEKNKHLSISYLASSCEASGTADRNPLFQVMFLYESWEDWNDKDALLQPIAGLVDNGSSKCDLSLEIVKSEEKLVASIEYDSHLYEETTIQRISEHFMCALRRVASPERQNLKEIFSLDPLQKNQLLEILSGNKDWVLEPERIDHIFDKIASIKPDEIAVLDTQGSLTYRQLQEQAARFAAILQENGAKPGAIIAVFVERNIHTAIAVLAAAISGGTFVPLDRAFPATRVEWILKDLGDDTILLIDQSVNSEYGNNIFSAYRSVILDSESHPVRPLIRYHNKSDILYFMYTSGSTGSPKAVGISHANLSNYLSSIDPLIVLATTSRWMGLTRLTFDISMTELLWPLTRGQSVAICDVQHGVDLAKFITEKRITHIQCTPSLAAQMIADKATRDSLKQVKQLLVGGEALAPSLASKLLEYVSGEVRNMYGPTEVTVWAASYPVSITDQDIPIGRPLGDHRFFLLNDERDLVPFGAVGEICIAGSGVAEGTYRNRPDLTAEKFIKGLPFMDTAEMVYMTGDLGCWKSDGNLRFVGRRDFQIKHKGHRIELGEIEAAIMSHACIKNALVDLVAEPNGSKHLCCWLVAKPEASVGVSEIVEFLKKWIPSYMIPEEVVFLDNFPLMSSGKADRKTIRQIRAKPVGYIHKKKEFVQKEADIAEVWASILTVPLEEMDGESNFFHLGGHSLSAMRLALRLSERFQRKISVRDVFSHPSIKGQLQLISE